MINSEKLGFRATSVKILMWPTTPHTHPHEIFGKWGDLIIYTYFRAGNMCAAFTSQGNQDKRKFQRASGKKANLLEPDVQGS